MNIANAFCDRHLYESIHSKSVCKLSSPSSSSSHHRSSVCQHKQSTSNGQTICLASSYTRTRGVYSMLTFFFSSVSRIRKYTIFHAIPYRLHSPVKAMRTQEILIQPTWVANGEKIASVFFVRVINAFGLQRPAYKNCNEILEWKKETNSINIVVEYRRRNAVPNIGELQAHNEHIIHFKYQSVNRTARDRDREPVFHKFSCYILQSRKMYFFFLHLLNGLDVKWFCLRQNMRMSTR